MLAGGRAPTGAFAMTTDAIDRLMSEPPFAAAPTPAFLEAVRSCLGELRGRFPRYDAFLRQRGAKEPHAIDDLDAFPGLFLPVLKGMRFDLPDGLAVVTQLTSSG